jgi:hypothetical protein
MAAPVINLGRGPDFVRAGAVASATGDADGAEELVPVNEQATATIRIAVNRAASLLDPNVISARPTWPAFSVEKQGDRSLIMAPDGAAHVSRTTRQVRTGRRRCQVPGSRSDPNRRHRSGR